MFRNAGGHRGKLLFSSVQVSIVRGAPRWPGVSGGSISSESHPTAAGLCHNMSRRPRPPPPLTFGKIDQLRGGTGELVDPVFPAVLPVNLLVGLLLRLNRARRREDITPIWDSTCGQGMAQLCVFAVPPSATVCHVPPISGAGVLGHGHRMAQVLLAAHGHLIRLRGSAHSHRAAGSVDELKRLSDDGGLPVDVWTLTRVLRPHLQHQWWWWGERGRHLSTVQGAVDVVFFRWRGAIRIGLRVNTVRVTHQIGPALVPSPGEGRG